MKLQYFVATLLTAACNSGEKAERTPPTLADSLHAEYKRGYYTGWSVGWANGWATGYSSKVCIP